MATETHDDGAAPRPGRGAARLHHRLRSHPLTAAPYRIGVVVVGLLVVAAGIAMLVLPGPGVAGILLGLAILGTEFPWAKRWVETALGLLRRLHARTLGRWGSRRDTP
ncbi:PGPGW domain-containing protein [Cellulomonas carbonis]|uniref:Transmembrane protein (PGPGW) n=1 Tax=Cellulomonas carbonis T26 TaxID=947969 RepID=A0A0A0BXE7_9CELL|nr:PGPGW domain-containing protein [Cellulomonas carbonis]KGM12635.1 hypothetical protein N868_07155 [Cellulomonas carbonis T26]GGC06197.1 hypothetical protein GCM10010972_19240 [Cellulomonas carbonis]